MYKACSKCGRIHDSKYKCNVNVNYNKYKTKEDNLRNTYEWHKKAEEIKEASNYLCSVCRDQGRYTYDNLEVHHIEKLRNNTNLLLDNYNLVCLCRTHHKLADLGRINSEYLRKLAMTREGNA